MEPISITRRSCVPTPTVRSPCLTSTSKRAFRPSTTSRSFAWTVQVCPSAAAATCLTQTSKPTVALPSSRFSKASIAALRSIIPIMPGVESTRAPIVPPTSVSSIPSTTNSSLRSIPGSNINAPPPPLRVRGLRESSDHPQPARDAERLAGDVGGVVGGEEGDSRRDLLRPAEPLQLGPALHRLDHLLADLAQLLGLHEQRSLDRARRDRVRGDPETGALAGDHLGEADHAGLGG